MTIQLTGSLDNGKEINVQVRGIGAKKNEDINLYCKGDSGLCIDWVGQRTNLYAMPLDWQFARNKYARLINENEACDVYRNQGYNVRTVMDGIQSQEQYERVFHNAINVRTPLALFEYALCIHTIKISDCVYANRGKDGSQAALHLCVDESDTFLDTLQLLNDKLINGKKVDPGYQEADNTKDYLYEVIDTVLVQERDPLWSGNVYHGKLGRGVSYGIKGKLCSNREIMVAELAYMMPHILIVNPNNEKEICPASEVYPQLAAALWKAADSIEAKVVNNILPKAHGIARQKPHIVQLLARGSKLRYVIAAAANVYAFYRINNVYSIAYAGALYSAAYFVGWGRMLSWCDDDGNVDVSDLYKSMRKELESTFSLLAIGIALGDICIGMTWAKVYNLYNIAQALYGAVTLKPVSVVASHIAAIQFKPFVKFFVCLIPCTANVLCAAHMWSGFDQAHGIEDFMRNKLVPYAALKYVISKGSLAELSLGNVFCAPINLSAINHVFVSSIVVLASLKYVVDVYPEYYDWRDDIVQGFQGVCDVFTTIALCNDTGCYDRISNALSDGVARMVR